MKRIFALMISLLCAGLSAAGALAQSPTDATPTTATQLPQMRWSHMPNHRLWNQAALRALATHGQPLTSMVPADIDQWCPYYREADVAGRQAFWVGLMSALAKHESTYQPWAVGGGGKWFGLLQIAPATARGYECRAGSGEALKDGADNLSCALRIMAVTVPRDGVIAGREGRWRGIAADWGPMRSATKRRDMATWLNQQPYCNAPPKPVRKRSRYQSPNE
ncbi:transglycosylase SLT domain-containing protein [Roseobacter sp. YSTF-M11]|uniref:Transglycosylase SLT domain-containing protein n=1 Tax=Roseobacter insulae TaxID=2859783 RepID=A0A9X1FUB4_9RHOB|nr:transglycosylase SLT domain-containing protein [Roseobacter insulae]MBW4707856.1 transglycosylase SLT domain-containing protein [Roseobacter insulae]